MNLTESKAFELIGRLYVENRLQAEQIAALTPEEPPKITKGK